MIADVAALPSMLPYALSYAERGWPVFPLHTPGPSGCSCGHDCKGNSGKHPRTKHGFKEATTDVEVIRGWWTRHPLANIGIVTGRSSGILVVDVDPKNGGDATWDALQQEHDTDPVTLTAETGSGGLHVYYQRPTTDERIASRAGAIPPGIDLKCDGGYVVAPPSLHFSGQRYRWRRPQDAPAPPPAWLLARLAPPRIVPPAPRSSSGGDDDLRLKRARAYLATMPPSISGSGGHRALWKAALTLVRGFDLSVDVALNLLLSDFNPRCDPPWSERELSHKVGDADRSELARGYLLDVPGRTRTEVAEEPDLPAEPRPPLLFDNGGRMRRTLSNLITLLTYGDAWRGVLAYDEFSGTPVYRHAPPWAPDDAPGFARPSIDDSDEARIIAWIERAHGVTVGRQMIRDAVTIVAEAHAYHPVREYLYSCLARWDRVPRMPAAARVYLGADPEDRHAAASFHRWLIAAVRRIMEPGCQSDSMLVLEGEQGIRKSSALRVLASDPWFADEIGDPGSRDAADALRGCWIVEIGELRWRRADDETRKAFLSRRIDHYRPAYGRLTVSRARQCVLAASTNLQGWQTDSSGARRYWAVACGQVDLSALARDRDQLWGEAMARYRGGEQSWLTTEEEADHREALQERREVDPWEEQILSWARDREDISIVDALGELKIEAGRRTQLDARRVGAILRRAGYGMAGRRGARGAQTWFWRRPGTTSPRSSESRLPQDYQKTENDE